MLYETYINTLLLFSQNYSIEEIAIHQNVTIRAIMYRLKKISIVYPEYYNNALVIRSSYARAKYDLANITSFGDNIVDTYVVKEKF